MNEVTSRPRSERTVVNRALLVISATSIIIMGMLLTAYGIWLGIGLGIAGRLQWRWSSYALIPIGMGVTLCSGAILVLFGKKWGALLVTLSVLCYEYTVVWVVRGFAAMSPTGSSPSATYSLFVALLLAIPAVVTLVFLFTLFRSYAASRR